MLRYIQSHLDFRSVPMRKTASGDYGQRPLEHQASTDTACISVTRLTHLGSSIVDGLYARRYTIA